MLPWARTTTWLLAGARTVSWSGPAELPLVHVDDDPRPAVSATVEGRPMVVHVDPYGPSRIGRVAAIRLGLDHDRSRLVFDAELGPVALEDVRAEVVAGEELVLGLGALGELAARVDRSAGTLRLVRASEADDLGPFPTPLPRIDARRTWASGPFAEGPLDGAATHSSGRGDGQWDAGRFRVGLLALDPRHPASVRVGEPVIGADALSTVSVACAPTAEACRFDPVETPWTADADTVAARRRALLDAAEERAATWTVPEPPGDASVPAGDPGSSWQAGRWLELSDAAWKAGDVRRSLVAAGMATRAGRDRCEPWVVLGERLLRGAPSLDDLELADVADPGEAAAFLQRAVHHLDLFEQRSPSYTLDQPESCRRARRLLDEARLASRADGSETALGRALIHLRDADHRGADVALRRHVADGGTVDVPWLAVHALTQLALGRGGTARGTLERLAESPDADALWVGTVVAHVARALDGEEGLDWVADQGSAWRAVVAEGRGEPRPTAALSLKPGGGLGTDVALRLARHPGDATAWALARWLGHDPPPGPPSADHAIVGSWLEDPAADRQLAAWPLVHAILAAIPGDPEVIVEPPLAVPSPRTPDAPVGVVPDEETTQETEMIPAIALATAALGADFDHTHAAFAEVLDGAVSVAGVDYSTIGSRRAKLDAYLKTVAEADASGFDQGQKLALYVNAYNAYTLQTMLDAGAGVSILDLDGGKVWDTRTFPVAGQTLTLNQMEHENARKLADGRVHAVVNCASKGCPPLPPSPLKGSGIDAQLTAAAKTWASHNAFRLEGDTVALSKIFDWYGDDFTSVKAERDLPKVDGKEEQALWFLSSYVDDATKAKLLSGSLTATWAEYDWSRNSR